MPLGLFELPGEEQLSEMWADLAERLKSLHYLEARRLPAQGRPYHLFFDPGNVRRYARDELNVKESSALAPLLYRAFARKHPEAMELFEVFGLNRAASQKKLKRLLGETLVERLWSAGMLCGTPDVLRSRLLAAPVGEQIVFHDTFSIFEQDKLTHVFFGRSSVRLARSLHDLFQNRRFSRTLDLCTGAGVQALQSSKFSDEVFGVDINPRAVAFAGANAKANHVSNAQFVHSDLFEKLDGRFDLITANTPFLLLRDESIATSGKGGEYGVEVTLRIFEGFEQYLEPGGVARMVVSTAWVDGRSVLEERLRARLSGQGYRVRLLPINTYYDTNLFSLYESLGVSACTLYVAEVERVGSELVIEEQKRPAVVDAAYAVTTRANRWIGKRRASQPPLPPEA